MEDRSHILERAAGVQLPADYRKFLNGYAGGAKLTDGTLRLSLATAEVLAAPFPFDQPRMDRPLFEAHFIYLGRMRDAGVLVFEGAAPVSPDRYAKMITIGFAERPDALEHGLPPTHVVVLDPTDGSVRLVPIDPPAVVRRVGESFAKWHRVVSKVAKGKPAAAVKGKAGKTKAGAKAGAKAARPGAAKKTVANKAPAKKLDVLATLKKQQKLTLPPAVERRIKSKTASRQVVTGTGRVWTLATPEELAETSYSLSETAAAKPLPFVRCTRAFADLLKAGRDGQPPVKAVPIVGQAKQKFTLARLRKGVCVGASNGDPLFLDPGDKYSVWTYSQDTGTVQALAIDFATFVKPKRQKKAPRKAEALKKAA